jgi:hypothetical protein
MSDKYIRMGPVAGSVPFDPDNDPDCGLTKDTVQEVIEELCKQVSKGASPGFGWGRAGVANKNVWLLNNDVVSNKTGIPFGLNNGELLELWVGNENISTFDVTLFEHDGVEINLTSKATVSLVSERFKIFNVSDFGTVNITKNKQLAMRVTDGAGKNVKVYAVIKGSS